MYLLTSALNYGIQNSVVVEKMYSYLNYSTKTFPRLVFYPYPVGIFLYPCQYLFFYLETAGVSEILLVELFPHFLLQ